MQTSLLVKIFLAASAALALSWVLFRPEGPQDRASSVQTQSVAELPELPTASSRGEPTSGAGRNHVGAAMITSDDALLRDYGCGTAEPCQLRRGDVVDPRVAESAEEAAWMSQRGFPTSKQREFAVQFGSAAVLQQASAERSTALRILGLETLVRETKSEAEVLSATQELDELAGRGRQHYALYAAVEAHLRVASMASPTDPRRTYHLDAAAKATKRAILLGDYKAIALYWMFPSDVASNLGFWARAEADAMARLHRGDVSPGQAGFGYHSVAPRPNPAVREQFIRDLAVLRPGQ